MARLVVVGGLVGLAAAAVLYRAFDEPQPRVPGQFSVLQREATDEDRAAGAAVSGPTQIDPKSVRISQVHDERTIVVARGTEDGSICLLVTSANSSMASCSGVRTVRSSGLYVAEPLPAGLMTVWGVVPDEVVTVEDARVTRNTFVFQGARRRFLRLVTSAGQGRSLDLGQVG